MREGLTLLLLFCLTLCITFAAETSQESAVEKRTNCPSNCSQHGRCGLNGVCTCDEGYGGNDCSAQLTALTSGVPVSAHNGVSQWHFFQITTHAGNGLTVIVNQTTAGGDVDLYMLSNGFPTRSTYQYRDTTTDQNFEMFIDNAGSNVWYIGLFGFRDTAYSVTAFTATECANLNDCNAHGQCISQGVCQCTDGWAGEACDIPVRNLEVGNRVEDTILEREMHVWVLRVTQDTVSIVVNETGTTGDVDLYVADGRIPTLWDYDYREISSGRSFQMNINAPSSGNWFFGFYGFHNTTYSFVVNSQDECPNNCSLHGSCHGGVTCTCNHGFSGSYCQRMESSLQEGVAVRGYVGDASWNYFHFLPNSLGNLVIHVTQNSPGDCDLYARVGSEPNLEEFDARDISFRDSFDLVIESPSPFEWYFGVFGYQACDFSLTVSLSNECPGNPPCSGHGTCNNGQCQCTPEYSGEDCSSQSVQMANGQSYTGVVPLNGWSYFSFPIVSTTFIAIEMKESSTVGTLWLYASKDTPPTLETHDYYDHSTKSRYHRLEIFFDTPQTEEWNLGVFSNPFAVQNTSFSIAAWYTPF